MGVFQPTVFQHNVFQGPYPSSSADNSDGTSGAGKRRRRTADDELSEAEVQFMHRKIAELKRAKNERERARAAEELQISLAQAAQDEEAAQVIEQIASPKLIATDYAALSRDSRLMLQIAKQLEKIVKGAQRRRTEEEDDVEILMLAVG